MRGHDQIITMLNDVLTAHFVQARMCENSGYERLWKKVREESIGEMRHADKLIGRILYLEGIPNLQRLGKVNVGHHLRAAQKSPQALRVQSQVFEGEPRAAEPHRLRRWPGWLERNARRAQGGPHKRTRRVVAGP
jgi:bacterioferritin